MSLKELVCNGCHIVFSNGRQLQIHRITSTIPVRGVSFAAFWREVGRGVGTLEMYVEATSITCCRTASYSFLAYATPIEIFHQYRHTGTKSGTIEQHRDTPILTSYAFYAF